MKMTGFLYRTRGDYDAFVSFEREEIIRMHNEMIEFINKIKELIED